MAYEIMTDEDLVIECKKGLGYQLSTTSIDWTILQKVRAVKTFMRGAGVPDEVAASEDAVGAIVIGVGDLWALNPGEVKFSPLFYTMLTQLACGNSAGSD